VTHSWDRHRCAVDVLEENLAGQAALEDVVFLDRALLLQRVVDGLQM
jgi:hypothetical protein